MVAEIRINPMFNGEAEIYDYPASDYEGIYKKILDILSKISPSKARLVAEEVSSWCNIAPAGATCQINLADFSVENGFIEIEIVDGCLALFLDSEPINDKERIVKAFIDNESITPIFTLSKDGRVDGRLFIASDHSIETVALEIQKVVLNFDKISTAEDTFLLPNGKSVHGWWFKFS